MRRHGLLRLCLEQQLSAAFAQLHDLFLGRARIAPVQGDLCALFRNICEVDDLFVVSLFPYRRACVGQRILGQVQFRRRFARNFTTQISYTYGHSIDSASNDISRAGFARILGSERGDSNFDIRHNLNFSGNYRLPAPMVPIAAAEASRDRLQDLGYAVEWHAYDMAHEVCLEEVKVVGRWLAERFRPA